MQNPNNQCQYYNWGGTGKYPSYPREYGARCEFFGKFFTRDKDKLEPNCSECFKGETKCK